MGYILTAPYNSADLPDGSRSIRVFLDAPLAPFTATLINPNSSPNQLEGGILYNNPIISAGPTPNFDTIGFQWETALNAADPESGSIDWTFNVDDTIALSAGLPFRYKVTRTNLGGGTSVDWELLWSDPLSTFPAEFVGFITDVDSGLAANGALVFSPYQAGRLYWNRIRNFTPGLAKHRGNILKATDMRGSQQITVTGNKTKNYLFPQPKIAGPRFLLDLADDPEIFGLVLFMEQGDPNVPLEALVDALRLTRKPLRWLKDAKGPLANKTWSYLQVNLDDSDFLDDLAAMITDDKGSTRYYSAALPLQEYVAP